MGFKPRPHGYLVTSESGHALELSHIRHRDVGWEHAVKDSASLSAVMTDEGNLICDLLREAIGEERYERALQVVLVRRRLKHASHADGTATTGQT